MNKINHIAYYTNPDDGRPISGGKLYIGKPGTDPTVLANQKTVYALQEDGTYTAISQPVYLSVGGTPVYNGANAYLYVSGDYSQKVLKSTGEQVFYIPDSSVDLSSEQGVYGTLADLKAASPTVGATYITQGYYTANDGGGGTYIIKTAASFGGVPDGYGDHYDSAGNVAVLVKGDAVNVKQYGAKGDGVADDYLPIKAACQANKKISFISSAYTYKISGTVTLSSNTTLLMCGATVTQTTDQTISFDASNTDGVNISGGKFIGKSEAAYNNTPSSLAIAIKAANATNIRVIGNTFENFWYSPFLVSAGGDGVEFSGNTVVGPGAAVLGADVNYRNTTGATIAGSNVVIRNNNVSETAQGLIVAQGSTNTVVEGNIIHDLVNEHGIYVDTGVKRISLVYNIIRSTGDRGTGIKVQCYDSYGVQSESITINGNTISNTGSDGILIDNTTASPTLLTVNVNINGNTLKDTGAYGIDVRDAEDVIVSGNIILVAGEAGIAWGNTDKILISGNTVRGSVASALRDLSTSNDVTIKDNVIKDCATGNVVSDEYGIYISATGDDYVVDSNIISDSNANMQYGIYIVQITSSGLSVVNNTVNDATGSAIRFGSTNALREYRGNNWNGTSADTYNDPVLPVVASAASIKLPTAYNVVSISGTTNINTIAANGHSGKIVTLIFQGALTVGDGVGNIRLASNFVTTADDCLTLACNGTNWFEVARAAN